MSEIEHIPEFHTLDIHPRRVRGVWRVVFAPWRLNRPRSAARILVRAPLPAFIFSYCFNALILVVSVLPWVVVGYMVSLEIRSQMASSPDAVTIPKIQWSTLWSTLHPMGPVGPLEFGLIFGLAGLVLATLIGAWLFLPTVNRGENAWRGLADSFRVVASGMGWLTLLTIPVLFVQSMSIAMIVMRNADSDAYLLVLSFFFNFGAVFVLLIWLTKAAEAVGAARLRGSIAPRCENCGYDLTHVPADGRCSECGDEARKSIEFGVVRCKNAWQTGVSYLSFVHTVIDVVLDPRRFYSRLALTADRKSAGRFLRTNLIWMGIATAVWVFLMSLEFGAGVPVFFLMMVVQGLLGTPLIGWCLLRFVAALATTWAAFRGRLAETHHATVIIGYESAFLWLFCILNGLLVTSFAYYDSWISELLGIRRIYGLGMMEIEPFVMLASNGALIAAWIYRFQFAFQRTRWSNF